MKKLFSLNILRKSRKEKENKFHYECWEMIYEINFYYSILQLIIIFEIFEYHAIYKFGWLVDKRGK